MWADIKQLWNYALTGEDLLHSSLKKRHRSINNGTCDNYFTMFVDGLSVKYVDNTITACQMNSCRSCQS